MVNTFSETFNRFLNSYSRMTEDVQILSIHWHLKQAVRGAARVYKIPVDLFQT